MIKATTILFTAAGILFGTASCEFHSKQTAGLFGRDETKSMTNTRYISKVWKADNGDGTYRNPILHADYSDPDVVRAGDDYYMTASSFTCFPGLPILHSKDLVNWTLIGHALPKYPNEAFDRPQHGKGVWAPCFRHHKGMFYIYWGDPDAGVYMVRSDEAAGPWEKPVLVLAGKGIIDPSPLWDEDGSAYLIHAWAGSRAGVKSLLTVRRMNPEGTSVSEEGRHVFDGHRDHPTVEGPKLYKRNGYYYIFAPAGGVSTGWQLILRSKDIYGPYQEKVVLAQGSTSINGPHQGGWVETPSGQSWFIHFQDKEAYGRVVHLQPVTWTDGWPVTGVDEDGDGKGEPVLSRQKPDVGGRFPVATPAESDEFNMDTPGLQWQWQGNPNVLWYARIRGTDYLRLFAIRLSEDGAGLYDAPNLLLQKFPAPDFTATTKITFTSEGAQCRAGLAVMGDDYACLAVSREPEGFQLEQRICKNAMRGEKEQIAVTVPLKGDTAFLRVTVASPDADCRFAFSEDGMNFTPIGEPFRARTGGWIGSKVGLFCVAQPDSKAGGYADFDWFRVE